MYFSCPRGERLEVGVGAGTGGPELVQVRFPRGRQVIHFKVVRFMMCKLYLSFQTASVVRAPLGAWTACFLSLCPTLL